MSYTEEYIMSYGSSITLDKLPEYCLLCGNKHINIFNLSKDAYLRSQVGEQHTHYLHCTECHNGFALILEDDKGNCKEIW